MFEAAAETESPLMFSCMDVYDPCLLMSGLLNYAHECSSFNSEPILALWHEYITVSRPAHLEKVIYHVSTERCCDRRAVFKAWTGVDFDEPGLQALINDKVISKELMRAPTLFKGVLKSAHRKMNPLSTSALIKCT